MKAAQFDYLRPASLTEALELLTDDRVDTKVMAGSQSLGPMLNLRLVRPVRVIDISALPELREVSASSDDVSIGACVTHAQIEDGLFAPLEHHPWRQVAANIAYRSVRNRGTIGGSLAHADPAADWVLAASAMNAMVDLCRFNPNSQSVEVRSVPMSEFMLAAYTTVVQSNELVLRIRLPLWDASARWGYYKFCRKVGEFAHASCALYLDSRRQRCTIVLGAVDGSPRPLPELQFALLSDQWRELSGEQAAELIARDISQALPDRDRIERQMFVAAVTRCLDRAMGQEG